MKRSGFFSLVFGSIIFALGIYGALFLKEAWPPILLFLGAIAVCAPAGIPIMRWREALSAYPALRHEPLEHESVFLARLFLSMSWIARCCGILSLVDFIKSKKYNNDLYHMGIDMVVDGYDPAFVEETLGNVICRMRERMNIRSRYLRQIGHQFAFIGLCAGITGSFAYVFRWVKGDEISLEGVGVLFALTAISLMMSALFTLLLPDHLKNMVCHENQIQKQILRGLLSLQAGDSFRAVSNIQYTFLTMEDRELLYKEPMFQEAKELNKDGNYEGVVADIRKFLESVTGGERA